MATPEELLQTYINSMGQRKTRWIGFNNALSTAREAEDWGTCILKIQSIFGESFGMHVLTQTIIKDLIITDPDEHLRAWLTAANAEAGE